VPLHSTQRPPATGDSPFVARPTAPPVGPPPVAPAHDSGQLSRNIPLHGIQEAAGQAGPGFAARAEPLPPPPWAQADAAALPPLPDQVPEPSAAKRIAIAVVVALLAAVAGFFAVRLIAAAATDSAAAPPAAIIAAAPGTVPITEPTLFGPPAA
jgi:hypothetical protein